MTDDPHQATDDARQPLSEIAAKVAHFVRDRDQGGAMSRGERAELRRMRQGVMPPEPYWRLVSRFEIQPRDELFWIDVVPLMVVHPHERARSLGRALAASRASPARIERWLRLDRLRARREAHRLFAHLDEGFDWVGGVWLLHRWDDARRRRFARDYYLAPETRERSRAQTSNKEEPQ